MIRGKIRVSLLGAALAIFLSAPAWAQEPVAVYPDEAAKEGITVHGHWTIEVVRDGNVVERREFQNVLIGDVAVAQSFGREIVWGSWAVSLTATDADICDGENPIDDCTFSERLGNLSVSVITSGENAGSLLLEGSNTVSAPATTVETVATYNLTCAPDRTPDDCTTSSDFSLKNITVKSLVNSTGEVAVFEGDTIRISVVISFS